MGFAFIWLVGGLFWLLLGGDLLVRGAVALSRRVRVPPMAIGLTVVALGTSAPELVVCLRSTFLGHPALALGNVVGSNIANVLLILGVPAVLSPMACNQKGIRSDTAILMAVSIAFFGLCATGSLGRADGAGLLTGLALFLAYALRSAPLRDRLPEPGELERVLGLPTQRRTIALFLLSGAAFLPIGADTLVDGAVTIAAALDVPESVIGLTIIAVGTSLPELATTVVAAFQRHADVAIGNVIGSNIINLLAIMGATAVLSPVPVPVPVSFLRFDLPVMIAATIVLASFTLRHATIGRAAGLLFLGGYSLYTFVLF